MDKLDQIEAVMRALSGDDRATMVIATTRPEAANVVAYRPGAYRWSTIATLRDSDGSTVPLSEITSHVDTLPGQFNGEVRPTWEARVDALHAAAMRRLDEAQALIAAARAVRP